MDAFHTVDKDDQDLLKVYNCENSLSLPGSRLRINKSASGTITKKSLTGIGTKVGYDGKFPMYLHLIKFLLTSNRLLL